ncbi:Splicing factor SF3a60-like [Vitis vinifera]|uniref:Splicing factor SF3a60-like n=1 Tax=Vitis vinifera TaxID=29760 RepID=A0A438DEF5_VITVI|nr:Splicing factor SF3a60-like [Vitis vinifera]
MARSLAQFKHFDRWVWLFICCMQEAKVLWERIQERQGLNKWRPDLEEEYEDKEGNIYNKKTYTDLQRQGLI